MNPRTFQWLTIAMAVLLVFEGIVRKFVGGGNLGHAIFFAKDALTLVMIACLVIRAGELIGASRYLAKRWIILCALFIPVIVATAIRDPILAVFGAKQYLLYPAIALTFLEGFGRLPFDELRRWLLLFAWVLIPVTTAVALTQLMLPPTHWLNLTTEGTSLEGFSAAGELRISSTFPFVAQYSMFLNFAVIPVVALIWWKRRSERVGTIVATVAAVLFVIGTFATGSRSAVWGVGSILAASAFVYILRARPRSLPFVITTAVVGLLALVVSREIAPEAFAAYDARAGGREDRTHVQEVTQRVWNSTVGWVGGPRWAPATVFGYGLGVMSNGSDQLSSYAREWRSDGRWTETDIANTLFEGGYYLVLLWMAFRLLIVITCLKYALQIRHPRLFGVGCVAQGFIIVTGLLGTLGIQPPLAIWFWMAVGLLLTIVRVDRQIHGRRAEKAMQGGMGAREATASAPSV